MFARIAHQLRGPVEAHRLSVENGGKENGGKEHVGMMTFHPAGGVGD